MFTAHSHPSSVQVGKKGVVEELRNLGRQRLLSLQCETSKGALGERWEKKEGLENLMELWSRANSESTVHHFLPYSLAQTPWNDPIRLQGKLGNMVQMSTRRKWKWSLGNTAIFVTLHRFDYPVFISLSILYIEYGNLIYFLLRTQTLESLEGAQHSLSASHVAPSDLLTCGLSRGNYPFPTLLFHIFGKPWWNRDRHHG